MTSNKRMSMTPINIGGVTIKNRYAAGSVTSRFLLYEPLGQYSANGMEFEVSHARGGFGLVMTGSNYGDQTVDGFDPLADKPSPLYAPKISGHTFRQVTDRVHKYGSKIFMQVAFGPGRMRKGKSCSELPSLVDPSKKTEALTREEIKKLLDGAATLAKYGKDNGFDGIEIHAHFGYLLDQFQMECTNHRTDEYGGDLDGRLRVYRELIEGIKAACGKDFPVAIRMGVKTYMKSFTEGSLDGKNEFGRDVDETIAVARKLESYGIDMFDFNVGTYESHYYCVGPYYVEKGYIIDMVARVKEAVNVPVFCVGLMDDVEMCEKALRDGKIDGITICRAAMVDTQYARKVNEGRIEDIRPCIQCGLCEHNNLKNGNVFCSANPAAMKEHSYGVPKAERAKNVVIIGGGIAGMVAAHTAARAGHHVALYEKEPTLGGHLNAIGKQRFKTGVARLNRWYQRELDRLAVSIYTDHEMTAQKIKELEPDVVILAQGSRYAAPNIEGIETTNVVYAPDVMQGTASIGNKVVVIGGGCSGTEIAYDLKRYGEKDVTLVEQKEQIMDDALLSDDVRQMLTELAAYYHVAVQTGTRAISIDQNGVNVLRQDGKHARIEADTVIIATGVTAESSMYEALIDTGIELYQIGDMTGERNNILTVSGQAYEIAREL